MLSVDFVRTSWNERSLPLPVTSQTHLLFVCVYKERETPTLHNVHVKIFGVPICRVHPGPGPKLTWCQGNNLRGRSFAYFVYITSGTYGDSLYLPKLFSGRGDGVTLDFFLFGVEEPWSKRGSYLCKNRTLLRWQNNFRSLFYWDPLSQNMWHFTACLDHWKI